MHCQVILFLALPLAAQLKINTAITEIGRVDGGGAASSAPAKSGTTLPANCTVGDQFFKTNATPGSNLYGCTATDTWTVLAGGGGGVTPSIRGTYGSLPSCGGSIAGQLFYATDGDGKIAQCNGTTWTWWYGGSLLTLPSAASAYTVLQSTGTKADSVGSTTFTYFSTAAPGLYGIVKAVPATPWTITIAMVSYVQDQVGVGDALCGFVLTDGTTGTNKGIVFGVEQNMTSGQSLAVKVTSFANGINSAANVHLIQKAPVRYTSTAGDWLQINDPGSGNLTFRISVDGGNIWNDVGTDSRTGVMTGGPTQFGVGCRKYSSSQEDFFARLISSSN